MRHLSLLVRNLTCIQKVRYSNPNQDSSCPTLSFICIKNHSEWVQEYFSKSWQSLTKTRNFLPLTEAVVSLWCSEVPSLDLNQKSAESNPHRHVSFRLPHKIVRAFSSVPCVLSNLQNRSFLYLRFTLSFLSISLTYPFSDLHRQLNFIVDVTLLNDNYDTWHWL